MADATPLMDVAVESHGPWRVLRVKGDLDMATGPELEAAALEGSPHSVALDLAGVGFIDSSGLRGLLRIRQEIPQTALLAPGPLVLRLLNLTHLTEAFRVVADLAELDAER